MNGATGIDRFWSLMIELARKTGAAPMNKHEGCWEYQVDDAWKIAVNGHNEDKESGGVKVPPYHCYIEFNGWPAGLINPCDGIVADGSLANLEALNAALAGAIAKAERSDT